MPLTTIERHRVRRAIADTLLNALEDIVLRYRQCEASGELDHLVDLRVEALTAELAHHLEVARSSLRRYPAVTAGQAADPRHTDQPN